jgi:hypothetical protein
LNYPLIKFPLGLTADSVQKVGFTHTGATIKKKRIIGVTRGLTYRHTACVSKAIARPYYKIIEGIIRVQAKPALAASRPAQKASVLFNIEIYRNKMTGYLLSCPRETALAIVA